MKPVLRIVLVFSLVWGISRSGVYLLPGDPAEFLIHEALVQTTPETLRTQMDLNRTPFERIFSIPRNHSLVRGESAIDLVKRALLRSLILTLLALVFAIPLVFGTLFLHFCEGRSRIWSERLILFLSSMPTIVIGPLLLRWIPLSNPVLPAFTLALYLTAFWSRALIFKMNELLPRSSVQGARALGFPEYRVFIRNLLAPSFGGFIAYFGAQLGVLLNGSLVVETLFHWPGLGSLIAESVLSRDYPIIEIGILTAALLTLLTQQCGYAIQSRWDTEAR